MRLILAFLLVFYSCTEQTKKPAVTVAQFSKQAFQINEVANKLMSEPNVKVMNLMADGVESTRAIACDSVGEECNAYYEFVNKVVDLTKDGELSAPDRLQLEKMRKHMEIEIQKSQVKLTNDWKIYINSKKSE